MNRSRVLQEKSVNTARVPSTAFLRSHGCAAAPMTYKAAAIGGVAKAQAKHRKPTKENDPTTVSSLDRAVTPSETATFRHEPSSSSNNGTTSTMGMKVSPDVHARDTARLPIGLLQGYDSASSSSCSNEQTPRQLFPDTFDEDLFVQARLNGVAKNLQSEKLAAQELQMLLWSKDYGLANGNSKSIRPFLKSHGCKWVVGAMAEHCRSKRIQELGINIFYQLFHTRSVTTEALLRACSNDMATTGLVGLIVGAMESSRVSIQQQIKGIVVVDGLLFHSMACTALFVKIESVPFLLETMKMYPNEACIQQRCALILRTIGSLPVPQVPVLIEDAGCLCLLTTAMHRFGRDSSVYAAAKSALMQYLL